MSNPAPEDSIPSTPPALDNNVLSGATGEDNAPLRPPPSLTNLSTPLGTSPRESFTPSAKAPLVPETEASYEKGLEENVDDQPERRKSLFARRLFWLAAVAAVIVIVLVVILPVYFTVIKPKNKTSSNLSGNPNNPQPSPSSNPGNPNSPKGLTSGGDGSTITMDNGTQFTYHNPFGGFCAWILFSRIGKRG